MVTYTYGYRTGSHCVKQFRYYSGLEFGTPNILLILSHLKMICNTGSCLYIKYFIYSCRLVDIESNYFYETSPRFWENIQYNLNSTHVDSALISAHTNAISLSYAPKLTVLKEAGSVQQKNWVCQHIKGLSLSPKPTYFYCER